MEWIFFTFLKDEQIVNDVEQIKAETIVFKTIRFKILVFNSYNEKVVFIVSFVPSLTIVTVN